MLNWKRALLAGLICAGWMIGTARAQDPTFELGVGLAESARVDRELAAIEHVSSPAERAGALGRIPAQVAAREDPGRAELILSKAIDAMVMSTAAEQVNTFKESIDLDVASWLRRGCPPDRRRLCRDVDALGALDALDALDAVAANQMEAGERAAATTTLG